MKTNYFYSIWKRFIPSLIYFVDDDKNHALLLKTGTVEGRNSYHGYYLGSKAKICWSPKEKQWQFSITLQNEDYKLFSSAESDSQVSPSSSWESWTSIIDCGEIRKMKIWDSGPTFSQLS